MACEGDQIVGQQQPLQRFSMQLLPTSVSSMQNSASAAPSTEAGQAEPQSIQGKPASPPYSVQQALDGLTQLQSDDGSNPENGMTQSQSCESSCDITKDPNIQPDEHAGPAGEGSVSPEDIGNLPLKMWRKYGEKVIKKRKRWSRMDGMGQINAEGTNEKIIRCYYRCNYPGCKVKRQIQKVVSSTGQILDARSEVTGVHCHPEVVFNQRTCHDECGNP